MELSPVLQELYGEVDNKIGRGFGRPPYAVFRPRIALSANITDLGSAVATAYTDAIIKAGGTPFILPITQEVDVLYQSLRTVDALVLTGGGDIHPMFMGEEPLRGLGKVVTERDTYELQLIRLARRLSLPILGICRGHQLLAVAYGSVLYQDIVSQFTPDNALDHAPQLPKGDKHHRIKLTRGEGNRLAEILTIQEGYDYWVNSLHHQAVREVFPPFDEVAISSDGLNEAIDAYPELDILGVQWHPEQMVAAGDKEQELLFEDLIRRAKFYHDARDFHQRHIVLDSHTDTPMFFKEGFNLAYDADTRVDLSKMELGDVCASVMVAYLPQGELSDSAHQQAKEFVNKKLRGLLHYVGEHPERAMLCRSPEDVRQAYSQGKRAIIPAVENGYAIGADLSMLQGLKNDYGIAYITLTHNGDNLIGDSACKSERTYGGLSDFGKELVREMNRLGIMIDVSHVGEESISDILALSTKPIIASHSSARSLCDHPRNLTDEQIVAIAEQGGVVQVCLYKHFISEEGEKASYLDAVDHIEHIIKLVGVEYVGIGSDFDGDGELIGCRSSEDLIRITIELLRRGYSEADLRLIWAENFLRVWEANLRNLT